MWWCKALFIKCYLESHENRHVGILAKIKLPKIKTVWLKTCLQNLVSNKDDSLTNCLCKKDTKAVTNKMDKQIKNKGSWHVWYPGHGCVSAIQIYPLFRTKHYTISAIQNKALHNINLFTNWKGEWLMIWVMKKLRICLLFWGPLFRFNLYPDNVLLPLTSHSIS